MRAWPIALLLVFLCRSSALAQPDQPGPLWEPIPRAEIQRLPGARAFQAPSAQLNRLNQAQLVGILQLAPVDTTDIAEAAYVEIVLPVPGRALPRQYERFRVAESPMLPASLQAHVGELRTYSGRGIDNPTLTTRFSVTGAGISAIVLGPERTWVIEPLGPDNDGEVDPASLVDVAGQVHVAVFKDELVPPPNPLRREGRPLPRVLPPAPRPDLQLLLARREPDTPVDTQAPETERRTFRLAVVATHSYVKYFADSASGPISDEAARDSALVAIVETMNQVQSVYEREVGVRFAFVPQQRDLIQVTKVAGFDRPVVDDTLLDLNQQHLDATLGSAGYDIGHLFTVANGGLAAIGCVCDDGRKGMGGTGLPAPEGKVFAIDYVAHEMGHQFGAEHTFNANRPGACSDTTRSPRYAFEPGSGSTIMGYAGTCKERDEDSNVEDESHDYFHIASLGSISGHLHRHTCGQRTPLRNRRPQVSAQSGWVIPAGTPFTLTASGTDPDGDSLVYTWEEYYPGPGWAPFPSPPEHPQLGRARPSFRSFRPADSPVRVFPKMAALMSGTVRWETLPGINRTAQTNGPLAFRVTARDLRGAFSTADVTVEAVARIGRTRYGPFRVIEPDGNSVVRRGDMLRVQWDAANTLETPIRCADVRITLDPDGRGEFAEVLSPTTPNDEDETVLVPTDPRIGGTARVRVECIGNIFFNLSPAFTLQAGP